MNKELDLNKLSQVKGKIRIEEIQTLISFSIQLSKLTKIEKEIELIDNVNLEFFRFNDANKILNGSLTIENSPNLNLLDLNNLVEISGQFMATST